MDQRHSLSAILTTATLLAFLIVAAYSSTQVSGGRFVGGRTKIEDVKTNQEVQKLGRFSVHQYNLNQHRRRGAAANGGGDLRFTEVVEAETQVVSGFKYYLKIAAATGDGVPRTFDAVVVVKPWVHSKELLNFEPVSTTI